MITKKETFTGSIEDLDAWIDGLSNDEVNKVFHYLTIKDMEQLKKVMKENKGKYVVTDIELAENSIVPDLKTLKQFTDTVLRNIEEGEKK